MAVTQEATSFAEVPRPDNPTIHEYYMHWSFVNFNDTTLTAAYPYSKSDPSKRLTKTADLIRINFINLSIMHAGAGAVVFAKPSVWNYRHPYTGTSYYRVVIEPWTTGTGTYDAQLYPLGMNVIPGEYDASPPPFMDIYEVSNYNAGDDLWIDAWGWYQEKDPSANATTEILSPEPYPVVVEKANIWPWKRD